MVGRIYRYGNGKLLCLFLVLILLNIATKQGWVEEKSEGDSCFSASTTVVPRLKPTVPSSVSFNEGESGSFTATFEELASWTISGGDNPNLIWEPAQAAGTMAVDITVRLRAGAPVLTGGGDNPTVCGGAKICATAVGSEVEACGWNQACAHMARIMGLWNFYSKMTVLEGSPLDLTISLQDPDDPDRKWEMEGITSDGSLLVTNIVWNDRSGTFQLKAENGPPCNAALCQDDNLPVTLRLRSGERVVERTALFTLVRKG